MTAIAIRRWPPVVTIEVESSNVKPVANAGADLAGRVGQILSLDGSASSDVEGVDLTFAWTLSSKPKGSLSELANVDPATASLIPDKDGTYTISLVVNDGESDSVADEVVVTVSGGSESSAYSGLYNFHSPRHCK